MLNRSRIIFILIGIITLPLIYFADLNIEIFVESTFYNVSIRTSLALGLYASVYGIDRTSLRQEISTIASAVTIGVLLKIIIISTLFYFISGGSVVAFLLGAIVAQIDPLSVASLSKGGRLSNRGQTVLRAWSSFDDPMTVIIALFMSVLLLQTNSWQNNLTLILIDYGWNSLLALGTFILYITLSQTYVYKNKLEILILLGAIALAVQFNLMLGIAIIGLFIRPNIETLINNLIDFVFVSATFLIALFLFIDGIQIGLGLALGLCAIIAQFVVALILTRGFTTADRIYLALAQQNGITAIILALTFETNFPGTIVSIVAPAIITINLIYFLTNRLTPTQITNWTTKA